MIQVAAGHEHILLLAEKQTDVRFLRQVDSAWNKFLGRRKTPRNLIRWYTYINWGSEYGWHDYGCTYRWVTAYDS